MQYLEIRNWRDFQHYKDRNPPWIKLATDTFQNYDFGRLQDASKLLAVCIWTLAARSKNGTVPADLDWIKKQCNLSSLVTEKNIKELINQGYIIDASKALADCYQSASPETYSKEAETETEEKKLNKKSFDEFWEIYPKQRAGSKSKANQAYLKALQRGFTDADILIGCRAYAASEEVSRGFAKGCAAWLNDDRFTNDYSQKPTPKGIQNDKQTWATAIKNNNRPPALEQPDSGGLLGAAEFRQEARRIAVHGGNLREDS